MTEATAGELIKAIERDNVITYKRKLDQKSTYKSQTDDEDVDSAPSIKTVSNPPLPELHKDKRKLLIKPFASLDPKSTNFVEKEVRQHDNILLKQRNNMLSADNLKLKTRISVLEKQNERLQKVIENDTSQLKPLIGYGNSREKIRPVDSTLRAVIRGLRKEVEDIKKENTNIKSAVKFTSLKELEIQRDHLAEEALRLRLALEEEQVRRNALRANFQGVNALEHRLQSLADKNAQLNRECSELSQKCKKLEENSAKAAKAIENERNLSKAIATARKTINEKDNQIEHLKSQLKTSTNISSASSVTSTSNKEVKFDMRRPSIDKKNKMPLSSANKDIPVKTTSKALLPKELNCSKCPKLEQQNKQLQQKCRVFEAELQKLGKVAHPEPISSGPAKKPSEAQIIELRRFLLLRFKAHRLSHEQSEKYLINCEGAITAEQKVKQMSVRELMQSLFVEPFCIVSNRYLEVLILQLAYPDRTTEETKIEEEKKLNKKAILQFYERLLPKYEIMSQQKEEEMFIQVAELITTYYQQILAALTAKANGQGTITEQFFLEFFKEIELEQEYVDFIITQIILESLDMDHLNFYAMFEIFYMPQMAPQPAANPNMKKKKFQVEHEQIVHEEDEEYEESKSHLGGGRLTTHEHKQGEQDYEWQEDHNNKSKQQSPAAVKQKVEEEAYAQEYEQEKASHHEEYNIDEDFE